MPIPWKCHGSENFNKNQIFNIQLVFGRFQTFWQILDKFSGWQRLLNPLWYCDFFSQLCYGVLLCAFVITQLCVCTMFLFLSHIVYIIMDHLKDWIYLDTTLNMIFNATCYSELHIPISLLFIIDVDLPGKDVNALQCPNNQFDLCW
jgi:hypothetical protein